MNSSSSSPAEKKQKLDSNDQSPPNEELTAERNEVEAETERFYEEFNAEKERFYEEFNAEKERFYEQCNAEKEQLIEEIAKKQTGKEGLIEEIDNTIAERKAFEAKIEETKAETEKLKAKAFSVSLLRAVSGDPDFGILRVENFGSKFGNLYPKDHDIAAAETKPFELNNIVAMSDEQIINWMHFQHSFLMMNVEDQKKRGHSTFHISSVADLRGLVQQVLLDSNNMCFKLLSVNAGKSEIPILETGQEMSIFTNFNDHLVIYDRQTKLPMLSVYTKKFLNDTIRNSQDNRAFGQCYDQLRAMKMKGHPSPFAAITSLDETYIAWLPIDDKYERIMDSHANNKSDRLRKIVAGFENKSHIVMDDDQEGTEPSFEPDSGRKIYISKKFESNDIVSVFTNVTLCALDATFTPRSIKKFGRDQQIKVDAIRMDKTSYQWGMLKTKIQGPLQTDTKEWKSDMDLFLVEFLGSGSTSVVYRALTIGGYECVVKIIVAEQVFEPDPHNFLIKEEEQTFEERSKEMVQAEIKAYEAVYGEDLKGYVWQQTLNNFECIIMPFFEPIQESERSLIIPSILETLDKFRKAKMMFKEGYLWWGQVGRFEEKIILFGLGDLACNLTEESLEGRINEHVDNLIDGNN